MQHDKPTDDRLYSDPELALFYDLENRWGPDLDYCLKFAADARSVLDLGCGTGLLAASLGKERDVCGVDPAAAMLDIARGRPGGRDVTWVQADARNLRLDRQFDLVLLTGHAFQVFLTESDQRAVLSTIARHLEPGGRFLFDTRNPAAEAWRRWTPELSRRRLGAPGLGPVEAWTDASHDPVTGIVTYRTHYRILETGEQRMASSRIRFTGHEMLSTTIEDAGLQVEEWLGDWNGAAFTAASPEIIPSGRRR
jgi:SAM-dependent methyltransferase